MKSDILETSISKIVKGENFLFRGYELKDLLENTTTLEETTYLLLKDKLPSNDELKQFISQLSELRHIPDKVKEIIENIPLSTNLLKMGGIAISYLSALEFKNYHNDDERIYRIISLVGPISVYWYKYHTTGLRIDTYTGPNDTIATNFFKLLFGKEYILKQKYMKVFNQAMVIMCEIGSQPPGSFVPRITVSTDADVFISIAAGFFAGSGNLHGSAVNLCGEMLSSIKNVEEVKKFIEDSYINKQRIYGFGHVYYRGQTDQRVLLLSNLLENEVFDKENEIYKIAMTFKDEMLKQKKLYPNIELYFSLICIMIGIPTSFMSSVSAIARINGMCAHTMEQKYVNKKIIAHVQKYIGKEGLKMNSKF